MLRTLVISAMFLAPGLAHAEELPASPMGLEIRADDGTYQGRVEGVERNREGRVVAVDTSGLEAPASAPNADGDLVAGYEELPVIRAELQRSAENNSAARTRETHVR